MEMNKEESEKCLIIAKKLFSSGGDIEKALRLCKKSINMFPTQEAKDLLESIEKFKNSRHTENEDNLKHRNQQNNSSNTKNGSDPINKDKTYNVEDLNAVKKIKNAKNHYEVLGLEKSFTEDQLKKSYRKLALQFHPDKNQTPGSVEAFKMISTAYAVLSDPNKRRRYDEYGSVDSPMYSEQTRNNSNFEEEISPEDIFNMFFGGGIPSGRVFVTRNPRFHSNIFFNQEPRRNAVPQDNFLSKFLQYLPLIILLSYILVVPFFKKDPAYSFNQRRPYTVGRHSSLYKIPYYVKPDFSSSYSNSQIQTIENSLESEYLNHLVNECLHETHEKEQSLLQARWWGYESEIKRIQSIKLASCERYNQIKSSA